MSSYTEYQNIKTLASTVQTDNNSLSTAAQQLTDYSEIQIYVDQIASAVAAIISWSDTKSQESILNSFLAAQKAIMIDFGVQIDVVNTSSTGYGESWGGSGIPGIKFTINKDGYIVEKIYSTLPVTEGNI